jgi:pyruvate ferredoxin oxidoreductase gamma subunit
MLVNGSTGSRLALPEPILRADFTALALEATGRLSALSTALGAAAASLIGLDETHCRAGIEAELGAELGRSDELAANVTLAREVYQLARAWAPVPWPHDEGQEVAEAELVDVALDPPRRAAPSIYAAANSPSRRTGNWRQFRPVLDEDECNRCWLCFVWCPEAAITLDENELPHVNYDVCKGCLLCAHECPTHAFRVEREVRS